MAAVLLPPSPYKFVEEMTFEEAMNKVHDLKKYIFRLYGKMHLIENEIGQQPTHIPEEYLDLPDVNPYPEEDTPNILMRSFAVDGSIGRDYYNTLRTMEECKRLIVKIEAHIAEMAVG
jgi:hypothetical protein